MSTQVDRTPRIKRGRSKGKGKAKRKSARENLKTLPQVLPTFSRKPLPEEGPCPKKSCTDDFCGVHCQEPRTTSGPNAYKHEIDVRWLGWAKGYGDGTFDVSCLRCGEIGRVCCVPGPEDVAWD